MSSKLFGLMLCCLILGSCQKPQPPCTPYYILKNKEYDGIYDIITRSKFGISIALNKTERAQFEENISNIYDILENYLKTNYPSSKEDYLDSKYIIKSKLSGMAYSCSDGSIIFRRRSMEIISARKLGEVESDRLMDKLKEERRKRREQK
jgi:hypothetical protein